MIYFNSKCVCICSWISLYLYICAPYKTNSSLECKPSDLLRIYAAQVKLLNEHWTSARLYLRCDANIFSHHTVKFISILASKRFDCIQNLTTKCVQIKLDAIFSIFERVTSRFCSLKSKKKIVWRLDALLKKKKFVYILYKFLSFFFVF